MTASDDAILDMARELGETRGEVHGVGELIRTAVIPRLDDMKTAQTDHETRLRALEKTKNEGEGGKAASAKWSAGVAAAVTMVVNGLFAIGKALAH